MAEITAATTTAEHEPVLRLPGFFPSYRAECKPVAAQFFHCFTSKGAPRNLDDALAGERGLRYCQTELHAYAQCMERALKQAPKRS